MENEKITETPDYIKKIRDIEQLTADLLKNFEALQEAIPILEVPEKQLNLETQIKKINILLDNQVRETDELKIILNKLELEKLEYISNEESLHEKYKNEIEILKNTINLTEKIQFTNINKLETKLSQIIQEQEVFYKNLNNQNNKILETQKIFEISVKNEIKNTVKQVEAFTGLQNYFLHKQLPVFHTENDLWPVSPDFSMHLVSLIEYNNYDIIIEFGSGISTVVIAKALSSINQSSHLLNYFISFDHLDKYYNQTLTEIEKFNLTEKTHLTLAPLKEWVDNNNTYLFYDCHQSLLDLYNKLGATTNRILVVVDGPPASTCKHARYPALPLVLKYFPNIQIDVLLDDYIRVDEKEIVELWKSYITSVGLSFTSKVLKFEKDACIIQIQKIKDTIDKTIDK
jgi:hypothetical protein